MSLMVFTERGTSTAEDRKGHRSQAKERTDTEGSEHGAKYLVPEPK